MKFEIVDLCQEYAEAYVAMSKDFYSGDAVLTEVDEKNFYRTLELIESRSPYLRGVILLLDGQIAGYGLLSFTYSCEAGGLVVWAEELYVRPEFRGKGLGAAYMKWLTENYSEKRIRLEVSPTNRNVMRLYERYGFRPLNYLQMKREPKTNKRPCHNGRSLCENFENLYTVFEGRGARRITIRRALVIF